MLYNSFTWLLIGLLVVRKSVADSQQIPISNADAIATAQAAAVLQATDDLLSSESLVASCSSCISLLQVSKNLAYISEGLFLSTLTSVCKRAGVDPTVVSGGRYGLGDSV